MKISILSYKRILYAFMILSLLNFTACSPQKKPEAPKSSSMTEEKKPPEELDKLRAGIEKVEKSLNSIYEEGKKPLFIQQEKIEKKAAAEKDSQNEGGEEQQSDSKEGSEDEGGNGESQGGNQEQQNQTSQQQNLSPEQIKLKLQQENYKKFEDIKKNVMELHSAWNSYEPKAIADFAIQSSINDFESTLNNLTKTVEMQDAYLCLLEINQLYKYLPDFYMLYETKVPPDLDRIRYSINKIKLLAEKEDYTGANDVLLYFENVWMTTRPKLKNNNIQMMSKFEFALSDLKNSVISKNNMIVEAKSQVLLKLVEEFEKAAEKEKK